MKKLLLKSALALATLMASASASAHDFEVDGIFYNITDSTANTVEVTYKGDSYSSFSDEYSGEVNIPSSVTYNGITYSVTEIGNCVFSECTGLISVDIPNSVTSIGGSAFYGCSGLTTIVVDKENSIYDSRENCNAIIETSTNSLIVGCKNTIIPNSVITIGDNAFCMCTGLISVDIPNSVTSIGYFAFYGCTGLTSVTIPSSVTSIDSYAFKSCGMTELNFNAENCTLGGEVFDKCRFLKTINIGDNVKIIPANAFSDCDGLTEVNITDLSAWCKIVFENSFANPLSYAGHLKLNGTEITNLVIPDDINGINAYAFYGCSSLTSVTIPNSVTEIGEDAFRGCSSLTSVTIPNSVTEIGENAFYRCSGLTSVTIPNSVTSIGNSAFYGCSGLTSVTISNSVTEIGNCVFSKCTGLISVDIPNSVTSIGDSAFGGCTGLTSVTIPNSVTSIGYYAFRGCTGLTSVTIPNSVTSISNSAFYGCTGLTSVTIPNSVTSIGGSAFYGCTGLTSVTIPNSVTKIPLNPFTGCSNMSEIIVATDNPYYDSRDNCNAIINTNSNQIIAGCKNTIIPNSVTSIGYDAFYGCTGLTSVTIPNSVTSISNSAFQNCTGLTSVTIPNSVTSISNFAFYGCTGLTSVTIPHTITDIGCDALHNTGWYNIQPDGILYLDKCCLGYKGAKPTGDLNLLDDTHLIADYAFKDCSGLTSVNFGNSLKKIGDEAFYWCTALTDITIEGSTTELDKDVFYKTGWFNNQPDGILYLDRYCIGYKGSSPKGTLVLKDDTRCIAGNAFQFCRFTTVVIPDSVAIIGKEAFAMCHTLSTITIPKSVRKIGEKAFLSCRLTTVTSLNPTPPSCDAFYVAYKATLYVPKDAFAAYFLDEVWGQFANIKKIETLADSISLSDETLYLNIGDTHTLNSEIIPAEATVPTICWTSDNPLVATVDPYGVVTGVSKGRAAITARAMDGSEVYSTCMVSVEVATSITLSQTEASLPVNDLMTLSYTILPDELTEKTATWSTSNPGVAGFKENADGSISIVGVSNGVATITATTTDGSNLSASCVIKVGTVGIDGIESDDNATEVARYDIHGRPLNEPTPGINIVKMSNGTTRKEIIK